MASTASDMDATYVGQYGALSSRLRTLPGPDLGSGSARSSIDLGTLYPAIEARQWAISSSTSSPSRRGTTIAWTASPHVSSGIPNTVASPTPGCVYSAASTSVE